MSSVAKKEKKSAFLTVIIISVLAWLVPVVFLFYVWFFMSLNHGVLSASFWIANGIAFANVTLLPLLTAVVVYRVLKTTNLARLAYAAVAAFGVTLFGSFSQYLLGKLAYWTPAARAPFLEEIGQFMIPQILVSAVMIGITIWVAKKLKTLTNNSRKEQWLRRFTVTAAALYLGLTLISTFGIMIEQYPSNPNMSAFVSSLVSGGLAIIVFLIFWSLEHFKKSKEPIVTAGLTTLLGAALVSVITSVGNMLRIDVVNLQHWLAAIILTVGITAIAVMFALVYRTVRRMI